jgi:hypothetical protein
MTLAELRYVFIDEFGGTALFSADEPFLIVAALICPAPRQLELIIKRAHERFGSRVPSGEMKAARSTRQTTRWVLAALAAHEMMVVAVIVDKRTAVKFPKDPERLYRRAAARAVRLCGERWPRLDVTLDKRYTHAGLRQELEFSIREGLAGVPGQVIVIHQEDSIGAKALQAVDYVAWAFGQKYARNDDSFCQLIKEKIVAEEVIAVKG